MNIFNIKARVLSLMLIALVVFGVSCKKDGYLTDGGLASSNTSLSTYDYLASNSYHYFDTVLLIIDHFGLKDSVNKAGTFFAPTNFSINRLMQQNQITSLDALYEKINSKFLTQYMFSDTSLTLNNASATVVDTFQNWAGTTIGLKKLAQSYTVATTSLTYYILQYVKINGVLDGSAGAPSDDGTDVLLQCQTTGVKTASGTNLNVFSNAVSLNMMSDEEPDEMTFTYNVNLTQSDNDYTSTSVEVDRDQIGAFLGLETSSISTLLNASDASVQYVAIEPDGSKNSSYTANAPGFWFGSDGSVVGWGDDAYLFGEFVPDTFILNVGQYPGHAQVGDTYTIKQAIVYTKTNGDQVTAIIRVNVTMVAP